MEKTYNFIKNKIDSFKAEHSCLRNKRDEYVFSLLCVKSAFYKNPSFVLSEDDYDDIVVDSTGDGGVDVILTDPNSENSDLILAQSKFYQTITFEEVRNAITKLALFYNEMNSGNYDGINERVQRAFLTANAEVGEESKVHFVFFTSAKKQRISQQKLERALSDTISSSLSGKYELNLFFCDEICDEITESESLRPSVESGKIRIDNVNNYLTYDNNNAAMVNVSAFSIKELYSMHSTNLLARNLRYHVSGREIDSAIKDTIKNSPDTFWYKNNGLTIICDDFDIDGKEVKLKNFSIVNGGQTTYLINKSDQINRDRDLFLPCKIIKTIGDSEDEKNEFSLDIAKATNSQKAIKLIDLKANAPEQIRFSNEMRLNRIFYRTKRGEVIPAQYREDYLNADLAKIGKLCLSAIFQMPGSSRSKPSILYSPTYYDVIFNNDTRKVAKLSEQLLYADYYFVKKYIKGFDARYQDNPNASDLLPFAHNSRTICISFLSFAYRYKQGNICNEDLRILFENANKENAYNMYFYDIFKNIDDLETLIPIEHFLDKDVCDEILKNLFDTIIISGRQCYAMERQHDQTLNATNFLKKDSNYYYILKTTWDNVSQRINSIIQ